MSEPKVQLIDPQGNISVTGLSAVGVLTASSLDGVTTGSATGLTGNPDLDVGIVTASTFTGQGDGHAANLTGTPQLNLGITTSTGFIGDVTAGKAAGLTGTPNLNVGLVTATGFTGDVKGAITGNVGGNLTGNIDGNVTGNVTGNVNGDITGNVEGDVTGNVTGNIQGNVTGNVTGNLEGDVVGDVTGDIQGNITGDVTGNLQGNVTGNVTGEVSGLAGALGINGINSWTGAGTSNLGVGVCTALELYGDGSALTGAGSSAYIAQNVTATGAETIIDLSYGNIIYYDSSSNTTIGFASTSPAEQITFIRKPNNSYTITWPDRVKWNDDTTPTLINNPRTSSNQVFRLTTGDTGLSYNAWEEILTNSDGVEFWTWGRNTNGSLAQNNNYPALNAVSSPVQIPGSTWSTTDGPYNGSDSNMVATKTDGTIWVWGQNSLGSLGLNNNNSCSSPIQLPGTTWKQASAGYRFCLATKTDGTLWAWGYGERGNLANNASGYYNMRSSPIQVGTNTNWDVTRALGNSSMAFKTDGTLWGWGGGTAGQLGLNTSGPSAKYSSPRQVGGTWDTTSLSEAISIAFCKKADGTMWAWGSNSNGELAQNNLTRRSSTVQVPGTWADISAGRAVLGTKTDGTLWTWGENVNGCLGLNQPDTTKYSSPVQIPGAWSTNVKAIQAGFYNASAAAIKADGTLWSWGYGTFGILGLNQGVSTKISSPTQIAGAWTKVQSVQENYQMIGFRAV